MAATGDVAAARAAEVRARRFPSSSRSAATGALPPGRELRRPGGNLTGIAFVPNQLGAKRVQLLRDLSPRISRVGLLMNPDNLNAGVEQADVSEGAAKLGVQIVVQNARNADEIDAAFAEIARADVDALIAGTDPVLLDRRQQIAALAERDGLPAISFTRQLAMAGMLMSYGPDIGWMYRQAGGQIARILKGQNRPISRSCSRCASSSFST